MLVAQSCPTLCDPMDCSPLGSSVHGILQARILEWVAISFSRGSSWPRDQTQASCIAGQFFTFWATKEVLLEQTAREEWNQHWNIKWCGSYKHVCLFPGSCHNTVIEGTDYMVRVSLPLVSFIKQNEELNYVCESEARKRCQYNRIKMLKEK